MKAALLLVDLQIDFLNRPGLLPLAEQITAHASLLLSRCRETGVPIFHIRTQVKADGSDSMPHWKAADYLACIAGSAGEASPPELAPRADEAVIHKRYFSGFENPQLDHQLRQLGADTLILAGIYLHGCLRATALDAYANGYRVLIADDATGSAEILHGEISRDYLEGRAASFLGTDSLLSLLGAAAYPHEPSTSQPVAHISGHWITATHGEFTHVHHNPADLAQTQSPFALAGKEVVAMAAESSGAARQEWSMTSLQQRIDTLLRWRNVISAQTDKLAKAVADEVGKPITDAHEELQRCLALIESCAESAVIEDTSMDGLVIRYRPVGTIGIITPWNNPIAIPVGKIAPALVYGNSVVWKPSPQAAMISTLLMQTLAEAGVPAGVVNLVFGDADTARQMMRARAIDAITITGSVGAGATCSALCTLYGKPLQAELGGNNAVIILADADLDAIVAPLARSAFSFSGQRCTAIRRFIVEKSMRAEFETRLCAAVAALRIGNPQDPATEIGPLITQQHLEQVKKCITRTLAEGARLLYGGAEPVGWNQGYWLQPTLIGDADPDSAIVQQETFGPVAVIQAADNLEHAIALANAVPHGLVAGLVSNDKKALARFQEAINAGILKFGYGPLAVHPQAPFGGWKASRIGPPEHGIWDCEFYAKAQAIYR